jgi:chromosome segregation ATPase
VSDYANGDIVMMLKGQLAEVTRERDEARDEISRVEKEWTREVNEIESQLPDIAALTADRDRLAGALDELLSLASNAECEYWKDGCEKREPQRRGEWCRRCGAIQVARAALKAQP